jgi:hypothetical protein
MAYRRSRGRRRDVSRLLYMLLWGLPVGLLSITFGIFLCCTIIFLPFGLAMIAAGFRILSYPEPTRYEIRVYTRR